MKEAEVVTVADQKGGVGKSTLTNAIVYELFKNGKKVLLIDADPQASQTNGFLGLDDSKFVNNHPSDITKIFNDQIPTPIIIRNKDASGNPKDIVCDFIPSNELLVGYVEGKPLTASLTYKDKIYALKNFISKVKHEYDYIVIDTQPLFGVMTSSVILAADVLIVPIATKSIDENGVKRFFDKTDALLREEGHSLKKIIVQPTLHQRTLTEDKIVLSNIKDIPKYISMLGSFLRTETILLDDIPQRAIVSKASAVKMFLGNYIELYENNKQNNEMLNVISQSVQAILKNENRG
jgi:chromosome partitioning protein